MLRPKFSIADIDKKLDLAKERISKAIINQLVHLGEKCVNEAREYGSYKDQTGNLRSSVSYFIVVNGRVAFENKSQDFGKIRVPFSNIKSRETHTLLVNSSNEQSDLQHKVREKVLNIVASAFPKGYCLIVYTGMNYAAYVEANGYNVLTTAEQLAKRELPNMLKQLKSGINKIK